MADFPINGEENTIWRPGFRGRWITVESVYKEQKGYAGSRQTPGVLGSGESVREAIKDFGQKARDYARSGGKIHPAPEPGDQILIDLDADP